MKNLALVTAILAHPAVNARHGAKWALEHNRFHFGPGAERAVQSGQILAHRERDGVHVYLMTAGYPAAQGEDGCDVYEDWCFAVLGISRRKFFAPLRRLRALARAQGDGKSAAWALVRASDRAAIDCHGVGAVVDCDETLPIASLGRGFSRHPATNPNRLARRRLGPVAG